MSELVARAQLQLLAKAMHVDVAEVAFLERLPVDRLHELRQRMSDAIFDAQAEKFRRISRLVPIVPLKMALPTIQKMVPPQMAGRAAGAVAVAHPKKAIEALSMLKPKYAAAAAPYLDPRAVEQIAHLAPAAPVVAISNEVLARGDYFTAGLFVDYATPELVRAIEAGVQDDEGILRAAALVYSSATLSSILRIIVEASPGRLSRVIKTTIDGPDDLKLATLSVAVRVDDDLVGAVGDVLMTETPPEKITELIELCAREDALPEARTLVDRLSPQARAVFDANEQAVALLHQGQP